MRSIITAAVLSLAALVAVPAFAAPAQGRAQGTTQRAHEDGGKHADKRFPMPAAEFKAKVDARQAKARARMEERAAKLPEAEAKAVRARFEANIQKVNAEVAKAIADGVVTKEEAKAVREANPHHGKHAAKGKHARQGRRGHKETPSK